MTFSDPAFRVRLLSRDAPAEAIEAAAQVLTEAFHGSSLEAIWGGDNAELAQARNVEFVTTTVLDLECYVAESVADGAIVGVMLVKPRGFEHRKR
jgi:hypothetical protein